MTEDNIRRSLTDHLIQRLADRGIPVVFSTAGELWLLSKGKLRPAPQNVREMRQQQG